MKFRSFIIGGWLAAMSCAAQASGGFHDLAVRSIAGKDVSFADYKGKVALIVNTASHCGFTPQYNDLQSLYDRYKDRGLVVLAFPSNDFGGQEPGSEKEIKEFCELNFKIKFPMFRKIKVKGPDKDPVYRYLTEAGPDKGEVSWNFEKFLVDKQGRVVGRFPSKVNPLDPALLKAVETALQ